MTWLQPLAWWGLVGIVAPILIHMLARHRSRRVLFPSLKFLQTMQVVAVRRRVISDWPLLVVRVLIIVLATAALAGPVFVSHARRASWNQRVARAIVVQLDDAVAAAPLADEAARTSFVHALFSTAVLPDALAESVAWLRQQPPAAREIVVVGDLRDGALTARDFDLAPSSVGVRFLPVIGASSASANVELAAIAEGPTRESAGYTVHLLVEPSRTRARYEVAPHKQLPVVRVVAGSSDQAHADAVLRAVLRNGILLGRHAERRVTIAFRGAGAATTNGIRTPMSPWARRALEANPEVRGGEIDGVLVASVDMPVTDVRAPGIVARVVRSVFTESLDSLEPRRISAATLARWSRPSGPVPVDLAPVDQGDRRWLWVAVLMLLAAEQFARPRRTSPESSAPGETSQVQGQGGGGEARVA